MVYSGTEWTSNDDGPSLLSYTKYEIDAANSSFVEKVSNGDFEPTRVTLPKGTYTVVAESDTAGTVSVPVAIEGGKTTVLHLETAKEWDEALAGVRSADLVRLPNGQAIGIRARQIESLNGPIVAVAQSKDRPGAGER